MGSKQRLQLCFVCIIPIVLNTNSTYKYLWNKTILCIAYRPKSSQPHLLIFWHLFQGKNRKNPSSLFRLSNRSKRPGFGRQCQTELHLTSTCFLPNIKQRGCQETHFQVSNQDCLNPDRFNQAIVMPLLKIPTLDKDMHLQKLPPMQYPTLTSCPSSLKRQGPLKLKPMHITGSLTLTTTSSRHTRTIPFHGNRFSHCSERDFSHHRKSGLIVQLLHSLTCQWRSIRKILMQILYWTDWKSGLALMVSHWSGR